MFTIDTFKRLEKKTASHDNPVLKVIINMVNGKDFISAFLEGLNLSKILELLIRDSDS
ncbi:MAG: hypothetical protein Q4P18_03100 [Methanobrevibacter sp.]|uniref:hypothetical protein n=1 Tax=Methanobrevibacter sp. TaxID=66852 RepID=UPI0026DF0B7E|nr:hypothetical protein [Methanobrevibacter sp.]MDO5848499.1 hypothetical protein [Methanobrevibacter sp.]